MGIVHKGLGLALIVVALARPACGCQCGAVPSIAEALTTADVAFAGRVVEVWPVAMRSDGIEFVAHRWTFRVDVRFRGAARAEETLVDTGGDCSFRFAPGELYLVFAGRDLDGRLGASVCSPTRALATLGASDLAALGIPESVLDAGAAAPESLLHRARRRLQVALLVACGALRAMWRGWGDTASGLFLRFVLTLAAAGALPVLVLLLRRRRFRLCAWIFLGGPLVVGAGVLGWAYWFALSHWWLADLAR